MNLLDSLDSVDGSCSWNPVSVVWVYVEFVDEAVLGLDFAFFAFSLYFCYIVFNFSYRI